MAGSAKAVTTEPTTAPFPPPGPPTMGSEGSEECDVHFMPVSSNVIVRTFGNNGPAINSAGGKSESIQGKAAFWGISLSPLRAATSAE